MDKVADVNIPDEATFKYLLLEISNKAGDTKTIIRGYEWAEYHSDIIDRITPLLKQEGFNIECLGGGRIRHEKSLSKIHVYGYSVGYGQAKHAVTVEILKKKYSKYADKDITWTNAGY